MGGFSKNGAPYYPYSHDDNVVRVRMNSSTTHQLHSSCQHTVCMYVSGTQIEFLHTKTRKKMIVSSLTRRVCRSMMRRGLSSSSSSVSVQDTFGVLSKSLEDMKEVNGSTFRVVVEEEQMIVHCDDQGECVY